MSGQQGCVSAESNADRVPMVLIVGDMMKKNSREYLTWY